MYPLISVVGLQGKLTETKLILDNSPAVWPTWSRFYKFLKKKLCHTAEVMHIDSLKKNTMMKDLIKTWLNLVRLFKIIIIIIFTQIKSVRTQFLKYIWRTEE